MKKIKMRNASLTAFLMILCLFAAAFVTVLPVQADEFTYNDQYLRISDFPDVIEETAQNTLNKSFVAKVKQYHIDFPVAIRKSAKPEGENTEDYADKYYAHNDFGYGEGRDGVMLVYYKDGKDCFAKSYGKATEIFDKDACETLAKLVESEHAKYPEDYVATLTAYLQKAGSFIGLPAHEDPYYTELNASGKPNWYPEKVQNPFPDYHNEGSPRVIDVADIFTDEEEAAMCEKIEKVQKTYDQDLIVFTDVDTYGLKRRLYAADFYQFGGYGFGEDYHGSILFISMKPGDRGWWTAARGNEKDYWFTQTNINLIDDQLEPYMKSGKYGEGVLDYLDNIYKLYSNPEWMPADPEHVERTHDAAASRVVDNAGILSDSLKEDFADRIAALSTAYDTDILLLTENTPFATLTAGEIGKAYFNTQGYGAGDDFDGMCFVIRTIGNTGKTNWALYFNGKRACYNDENKELLYEWIEDEMGEDDYDKACDIILTRIDRMYEKGRVRPKLHMILPLIIGVVLGLILMAVVGAFLVKGMKTVETAAEASHYLVKDSFVLIRNKDRYKTSTISRVYNPPPSDDGGSSSGGGSSYSSNYSSSGGGSFSGGGRSF